MKKIGRTLFLITFSIIMFVVWKHNVTKGPIDEDVVYIKKLIGPENDITNAPQLPYNQQINLIKNIQSNVLRYAPFGEGIPINQERRPKDLYKFGEGLCYDRSFSLELIFQYLGFDTRHVSVFKNSKSRNNFIEVFGDNPDSHALCEVLTANGWMIIDTNDLWIGLDEFNQPVSMKKIHEDNFSFKWLEKSPNLFFTGKHHYIYGLYSRHGRFYKPYNVIPDYNLSELFYNF